VHHFHAPVRLDILRSAFWASVVTATAPNIRPFLAVLRTAIVIHELALRHFSLRFTQNSKLIKTPETFRFRETILQSAIRRHLMSDDSLQTLLSQLDFAGVQASALEILGEKAPTQGHIDLLLKQRVPLGSALKIPMEVKTNRAQPEDVDQLRGYMDELLGECPFGMLIAADFSKRAMTSAPDKGIRLVRYKLNVDLEKTQAFEEIYQSLTLEPLGN